MRHANSQALLLRIAARLVLINPAQVELLATPFKHELPAARIADFDEFIDGEPRVVMQRVDRLPFCLPVLTDASCRVMPQSCTI